MFFLVCLFGFGCRAVDKTEAKQDINGGLVAVDQDNDGYPSPEDCDDQNELVNPGAVELCDGVDNNCDAVIDEDVQLTFYADSDGDGFGNPQLTMLACEPDAGFVSNESDCDDADPQTYPSAEEICDTVDNDCDDEIDEGLFETYYMDADNDGFGDENQPIEACALSEGLTSITGDCDDGDATRNPLAEEICDEVDNNCDGDIDEGVKTLFYLDVDIDGYGDPTESLEACEQPAGYIVDNTDCDDNDDDIFPSAPELCNGEDDNCDGQIDESSALDALTWYEDSDNDGYGNVSQAQLACEQPADHVDNADDCNDGDDAISPLATEDCDGVDNNCDGQIDELGGDGETVGCAVDSCAAALAENPSAQDGVYYILNDVGDPIEAWCEMDFDGGGWLSVYNFIHPGDSLNDAATMHSSLISNTAMSQAIAPNSMSTAVSTSNIDLAQYSQVVFGWASSQNTDISRWGRDYNSSDLQGYAYLDGYPGAGVAIGLLESVTGTMRTIYTGNSPSYPHVGLGFSGQIIVWGYDLNNSSYGHWANWYDLNSCCQAGNTSDMNTGGWRYVIYIR